MKTITAKLNREQMEEQLKIWQKAHEGYIYREDWKEEDYNAMWDILAKGKEEFDPKKIANYWYRFELSFSRNRFKNVDDYFCSGVEGVGFGYITNKKELNEEFGKENIFEVKDSMSILIRLTKDCLYYLTENPNERKIYN